MQIRIATKDDSHAIAEIYAPIVERTHISFELVPPTAEEMARRMAVALENHVSLVAEDAGRIQGYAYAGKYREKPAYRWSTETTIYVGDGSRGKGVGRSLYRTLLRILAAQNYRRAFAGIALPNEASIALHAAVGSSISAPIPKPASSSAAGMISAGGRFRSTPAKANPLRLFR